MQPLAFSINREISVDRYVGKKGREGERPEKYRKKRSEERTKGEKKRLF